MVEGVAGQAATVDRVPEQRFPEEDLPTVERLQAVIGMQVFVRSRFRYSGSSSTVELPPFVLKQTEVTLQEWGECASSVDAGCPRLDERYAAAGRTPPRPLQPVEFVALAEAEAYCRWAHRSDALPAGYGGRLPTDAEWERAAAGPDAEGRPFPTGDRFDPSWPTVVGTELPDAGSCTDDRVINGLHDMVGSVEEWVQTKTGPAIRGGRLVHVNPDPDRYRTTFRQAGGEGLPGERRGFRCAVGPLEE